MGWVLATGFYSSSTPARHRCLHCDVQHHCHITHVKPSGMYKDVDVISNSLYLYPYVQDMPRSAKQVEISNSILQIIPVNPPEITALFRVSHTCNIRSYEEVYGFCDSLGLPALFLSSGNLPLHLPLTLRLELCYIIQLRCSYDQIRRNFIKPTEILHNGKKNRCTLRRQ